MRGMQRLDNAACISTEADHVVSGLGSDFLQDKCSWQGSMGGGGRFRHRFCLWGVTKAWLSPSRPPTE